jgi:hypothetical protein
VADLTTDGYTVLRGVVPDAALEDLRARIEEAVAQRSEGVQVRAGTVWIKDAHLLGDGVAALCVAPEVVSAVTGVLGPSPVPLGAVMRHPVGAAAQQAMHVDWAGPGFGPGCTRRWHHA